MLYADRICGPLSDLTFAMLLTRIGIRWEYRPMAGLCEIVWPPICGIHLIQLERDQTPAEKRLALRHGVGHALAGDCQELSYSHDGHDWRSFEESAADCFASIDLVPDTAIRDRLEADWTWSDVGRWIRSELQCYGASWSAERVRARTEQRLLLFAEREGQRQEGKR